MCKPLLTPCYRLLSSALFAGLSTIVIVNDSTHYRPVKTRHNRGVASQSTSQHPRTPPMPPLVIGGSHQGFMDKAGRANRRELDAETGGTSDAASALRPFFLPARPRCISRRLARPKLRPPGRGNPASRRGGCGFQAQADTEHQSKVGGSLEGWQEHVAKPCVGSSRLVFAISCAFAAPLLSMLNEEWFRAISHLLRWFSTGLLVVLGDRSVPFLP